MICVGHTRCILHSFSFGRLHFFLHFMKFWHICIVIWYFQINLRLIFSCFHFAETHFSSSMSRKFLIFVIFEGPVLMRMFTIPSLFIARTWNINEKELEFTFWLAFIMQSIDKYRYDTWKQYWQYVKSQFNFVLCFNRIFIHFYNIPPKKFWSLTPW